MKTLFNCEKIQIMLNLLLKLTGMQIFIILLFLWLPTVLIILIFTPPTKRKSIMKDFRKLLKIIYKEKPPN